MGVYNSDGWVNLCGGRNGTSKEKIHKDHPVKNEAGKWSKRRIKKPRENKK